MVELQKGNCSTQKRTGPPLIRPSQWWWSKAITNWSPSPVVCKCACNERAMLALEQKLVFAELTSHVTSEQANKPEHGAMKKKKMMMKMQRPKLFNYAARRMAKLSCTETMANDDDDAVCLRLAGAGDVLGWLVERWFSVSPNVAAFSRTDTDGSRLLVRRLQQNEKHNENENGKKKKKTGMIKEEEKEEKTSAQVERRRLSVRRRPTRRCQTSDKRPIWTKPADDEPKARTHSFPAGKAVNKLSLADTKRAATGKTSFSKQGTYENEKMVSFHSLQTTASFDSEKRQN
ncbi:hypothetical protein T07_9721 [Trichinella nelsoni]|uniref:Uncharacterized protein n=1 Tax=Trichinella nelsoni TaxID=6336 RepID=A0A0V0S5J3_9BILA|nr:hypothetical protein T07_9721 [Trichinella nelsoni]